MVELLLKRYLWLIDSLKRNGEMTFDFIQELLLHRDQMEVLSPQSLRDELNEIITKMKNRDDE